MDLVEPWVIRSAVVVGLLAAANVWLFLLSTKLPAEIADVPRHLGNERRRLASSKIDPPYV